VDQVVDQASPIVRIVVVQPPHGLLAPDAPPHTGKSAGDDTVVMLKRIGGPVEIEKVRDAAGCLGRVRDADVQLVIVEPDGLDVANRREAMGKILEALRGGGPPVVVVVEAGERDDSVEAFRLGATDCVCFGEDYGQVLPVVALEQIRRWRRTCERDRAARHIRWLEHLNDAIVSEIPAALLVVDGEGRVEVVNPEFTRDFGVSSEAAVGRPLGEVLPEPLVEAVGIRSAMEAGDSPGVTSSQIARLEGVDGQTRVYDARWKRLGDTGRILFVLSDVTERQLLARRVSDLQRYNDNIIQNINSALLVVDNSGEVAFANPTAEQILGAGPGALIGRSIWNWFRSASKDQAHLARTLEDGSRFRGAEAVITRDDGSIVPIGISCTPLTDTDGSGFGAVAIFQDLTEIKQLQRQVLQTEKMASIGQLAAGVAHEINNPMGFIHANLFQLSEYAADLHRVWAHVEELQEAVTQKGEDEIRRASKSLEVAVREADIGFVLSDFSKAVRESQEGSERIRHIVEDLRDFSHPDTAEPMLSDVKQCVDSTASIVWTMMKHSVRLEKTYGELPPVRCFPMQLKQVFMNLLVNAYQSIQERVGSSGEMGEISIRTEAANDGVRVTIRDTGTGIAPENLPRLFDPFFTTKEVGAGTGLGLSTSYSIVQRHGGTIQVESQLGEGSSFEVWLPCDGVGVAAGGE